MTQKLNTNRMVTLWGNQLSYQDHLEDNKASLQEIGVEYWRGTNSMFVYVPHDISIGCLVGSGMSEVFATIVLKARQEGIAFFFVNRIQHHSTEIF